METEKTKIIASYEDENMNEIGTMDIEYDDDDRICDLYWVAIDDCENKLEAEGYKVVDDWAGHECGENNLTHCSYIDSEGNRKIIDIGLYVEGSTWDLIGYDYNQIADVLMTYNGVYWYAHEVDEDDNDWGDGTFDRAEAIARLKEEGGQIAVIEGGPDPECVEIIKPEDI